MTFCSKTAVAIFLALNNVTLGFVVPSTSLRKQITPKGSILNSAVVSDGINGLADQKAWECDEDANCVQVDACDEMECRTSLDVRIHGQWYDLSGK